ncbi:hypothetical protein ES703_27336 [subsurface metagenome]
MNTVAETTNFPHFLTKNKKSAGSSILIFLYDPNFIRRLSPDII